MANENKVDEKNEKRVSYQTKAALLLCLFPEALAQQVIGHLENEERKKLYTEIANIKHIADYQKEVIEEVVRGYLDYISNDEMSSFKGGAQHARRLIGDSMPTDEFDAMLDRLTSGGGKPFDSIKKLRDITPLLMTLHEEDPYVIALTISLIKTTQAAEILENLPEEKAIEVVRCAARLDQTNAEAISTIERYLAKKLEMVSKEDNNITDGLKTVVSILNNVNRSSEKVIFEKLDVLDPELSQEIRDNMFVFENLVLLDARQFQDVVNKITDDEVIVKALRAADEELKERFYKSMPQARREIVQEIEERIGGVRLTDAEEAQQKIANIVKEMTTSGQLIISRGDGDVIL